MKRRVKFAPGFRTLLTPVGHEGGIGNHYIVHDGRAMRVRGAEESAVALQACFLRKKLNKAIVTSNKIVRLCRKKGLSLDSTAKRAIRPFRQIVGLLRDYDRESQMDSDGTVTASMASALMAIEPGLREVLLGLAGDPKTFRSLRQKRLRVG